MNKNGEGTGAKVVEYGLLGLLVFSPLPAASVYEWSVLILGLTALALTGAYILMREKPRTNEFLDRAVLLPKRLFFFFFLFLLLQIVPLPRFIVSLLSPGSTAYQQAYALDFEKTKFLSFSLIPSLTLEKALELVAYFLVGFVLLKTMTTRRRIIRIYSVLIAVGAFEAFYGLFELYSKNPRILFYRKMHNLDSVTGTFVNRNHLSGYLEMVIPLAIGLIISRIDLFSLKNLSWREKLLRLAERGLATNLILLFAVVLMSVAVVFSKSRSGVFVLVLIFILFFGLTAIYFEIYTFRKKRVKNFLRVAFVLVLIISLYVGIDSVLQRFSLDKLLHEGRPVYWAATLRTFAGFPLFGTGLGTFGALAAPIQGAEGPLALEHAHNDYLEYLSELGVIGSLLLLGGILFSLGASFNAWRTRKHPEVKGLALGGIVSLAAILVHSATDFNLHIPANMLLFSVILALTMVTAFFKKSAAPKDRP
ncbi:MAG: O-antigen ligase family protein [Candidatus Aminicenantales bacterium]